MQSSMTLYLIPMIAGAGLTGLFLWALMRVRVHSVFASRTGGRHGARPYIRIGGVAMSAAFFLTLVVDQHLVIDGPTAVFLVGMLCFVLLGIWDDIRELSWKAQLGGQVCIAAGLFFLQLRIDSVTHPLGGIITFDASGAFLISGVITVAWIIGMVNALNWSDGMHGLAGGVSVIAGSTLFVLALRPEVYQPPIALIAATFVGCALIFTVWNVLSHTVIAGTSGSSLMGYVIAVLAIFAGAKIGTALLVMVVPLMDAFFVIWQRFAHKESIFAPDERHLHHRLRARGWSTVQILTVYYSLTIGGAIAALTTASMHKFVIFVIYGGFLLAAFYVMRGSQKKV